MDGEREAISMLWHLFPSIACGRGRVRKKASSGGLFMDGEGDAFSALCK